MAAVISLLHLGSCKVNKNEAGSWGVTSAEEEAGKLRERVGRKGSDVGHEQLEEQARRTSCCVCTTRWLWATCKEPVGRMPTVPTRSDTRLKCQASQVTRCGHYSRCTSIRRSRCAQQRVNHLWSTQRLKHQNGEKKLPWVTVPSQFLTW